MTNTQPSNPDDVPAVPVDPAALGWRVVDLAGFANHVGPFWTRTDAGVRRFACLTDARHRNGQGMVHGGMLVTFIDQALGLIVREAVERQPCATVQLNTQFVAAGRPGDFIEMDHQIIRRTRSLVFIRGTLHTAGRTVLSAEGIWKVLGV